ncbi:helix-turn-helix domain-containing protein [Roseomonas xinghualingensis]|uniref:helix-turn-helix domain-containing protein n=1 Tax=Roseomonas xinghualingensis TaxID=2986475 RepID=UPI0021F199EC|nr:helix-turn-helix domain-containing protein [Roseomonas sp. SXEYE001]MCV4209625.1 helix-turn-helix domain-containing protein [Roseomonas sp. SXEYE001]
MGRTLRFQRGAEVYAEGNLADHLYKVVAGAIRTCRILPDGRRMIAHFALQGDLFGLDGVQHHRFFAEAVTDTVVIAFPRKEITEWVSREPGAAHSWNTYTLEKLTAAQDRFIMLGRRTAAERVAAFLLDLADRGQRPDESIDLPMSRYDIADYLGLTSETVSRLLSNLRKNRIIAEQGSHRFRILNREALEERADEESI